MKKYQSYDYEEIFDKEVLGEESVEDKIQRLKEEGRRYKYKCRTWICGEYLESEIFPVFERKGEMPRGEKRKETKKSQKNLNHANSKKMLIRYFNLNFGKGDLSLDLTYAGEEPDEKQAKKDITNFLRKIARRRKKAGLDQLKYIYVIEFTTEDEKGNKKRARIHHHVVLNDMDRDVAEKCWTKGRANSDRLQPDENGLIGKALYIVKYHQKKGMRKWEHSRNLKKPKAYESVTKLTKRKAEKLAKNPYEWQEVFEKLYKDKYAYNECKRYVSDLTGGVYLYCRMRRRI